MGASSSVLNADLETVEKSVAVVPLNDLESHLRLFQHCESGEILVLVENSLSDLSFITEPLLWMPVKVSSKEGTYLRKVEENILKNAKQYDGSKS